MLLFFSVKLKLSSYSKLTTTSVKQILYSVCVCELLQDSKLPEFDFTSPCNPELKTFYPSQVQRQSNFLPVLTREDVTQKCRRPSKTPPKRAKQWQTQLLIGCQCSDASNLLINIHANSAVLQEVYQRQNSLKHITVSSAPILIH